MLRVNYPKSHLQKRKMEEMYLSYFDTKSMQDKLDKIFGQRIFQDLGKIDIENLLIGTIESVYEISSKVKNRCEISGKKSTKEELQKIFNYDDAKFGKRHQTLISAFFMEMSELQIATCHYCNIDYINSFKLLDDFQNGFDLVKRGTKSDFMQIKDIGNKIANKILLQRELIHSLNDLNLPAKVVNNLRNMTVKESNNHFTLDHVLDKASYPVAALSLYNFVPCCYSCNSKFKQKKQFVTRNVELSPTSEYFSFSEKVTFGMQFPLSVNKTYNEIKKEEDFVLKFNIKGDKDEFENYIKVFKLRARYKFHKGEIVRLITKRKTYSDSQIREIAKLVNRSTAEVKKDLFGEELFLKIQSDKPLSKLKYDISKDLGIIDKSF